MVYHFPGLHPQQEQERVDLATIHTSGGGRYGSPAQLHQAAAGFVINFCVCAARLHI